MTMTAKKRPTKKIEPKIVQYRCDSHLGLTDENKLYDYNGMCVCPKCYADLTRQDEIAARPNRHKTKEYFAVQIYCSEGKATHKIKARFKALGLSHLLGDIVIPKTKVIKISKKSWAAYDDQGRLLGHVQGEDEPEAFDLAKRQFGKNKGGRGCYKPEPPPQDVFSHVVKIRDGRRIVYDAISDANRVMGRLGGHKTIKSATIAAEKLYGPKKISTSPREGILYQAEVAYVELVREGGNQRLQNVKAMNGYLIVRLEPCAEAFQRLKECYGVSSLMPYPEKPTDKEQKSIDGGTLLPPPDPCPVPDATVNQLVKKQQNLSIAEYKKGDRIFVTDGPYKGIESVVDSVTGPPNNQTVQIITSLLGRQIKVNVRHTEIKKFN